MITFDLRKGSSVKISLKTVLIVSLIAQLYFQSAGAAQGTVKKTYRFGVFFNSSGGISAAQYYDFTLSMCKAVGKALDFECNLIKYSSYDEENAALVSGKIDLALITDNQIMDIFEKSAAVYPIALIKIKDQRKHKYCLWQSKQSTISDIQSVKGKTLVLTAENLFNLTLLREYLAGKGIDKPLWKTFSAFTMVTTQNSAMMVVAAGKADFYFGSEDYVMYLKLLDSSLLGKLKHDLCTDYVVTRSAFVVNRKTVSELDAKRLKDGMAVLIGNLGSFTEKDKNLRPIVQLMKTIKATFVVAEKDEFAYESKLYQKAKKKGWLKEGRFIDETLREKPLGSPVSVKQTYKWCRSFCSDKKDVAKCIDACMGG